MCQYQHFQCTCEHTVSRASVIIAENVFPDHGCYKGTYAHTQVCTIQIKNIPRGKTWSYNYIYISVIKFFLFHPSSNGVVKLVIFSAVPQAKSHMSVKNVTKHLQTNPTCERICKPILQKNHISARSVKRRLHSNHICTNMKNPLAIK